MSRVVFKKTPVAVRVGDADFRRKFCYEILLAGEITITFVRVPIQNMLEADCSDP